MDPNLTMTSMTSLNKVFNFTFIPHTHIPYPFVSGRYTTTLGLQEVFTKNISSLIAHSHLYAQRIRK